MPLQAGANLLPGIALPQKSIGNLLQQLLIRILGEMGIQITGNIIGRIRQEGKCLLPVFLRNPFLVEHLTDSRSAVTLGGFPRYNLLCSACIVQQVQFLQPGNRCGSIGLLFALLNQLPVKLLLGGAGGSQDANGPLLCRMIVL